MFTRMIFDISMPLREGMPTYAGNAPFRRILERDMRRGDPGNLSRLEFGAHAGTHLDAPIHFEPGGYGAERVPLESLLGPARVFHLPDAAAIERPDLERLDWKGVERVLFRTRNSDHWKRGGAFDPAYVYLTGPAAEFLAARRMRLVGTDGLGVERFGDPNLPAHHALLRAGVAILEGLCLADVPPGDYYLFCGPLKIEGSDGAPARAFLLSGTADVPIK